MNTTEFFELVRNDANFSVRVIGKNTFKIRNGSKKIVCTISLKEDGKVEFARIESNQINKIAGMLGVDFDAKTKRSRMGRNNKSKGGAVEREIKDLHIRHGVAAMKVPLSGAMSGYPGDVVVLDVERPLVLEAKARKAANGFKKVKDWLSGNDLLFLRTIATTGTKKGGFLVVMNFSLYISMLKFWEKKAVVVSCKSCKKHHLAAFENTESFGKMGVCKNNGKVIYFRQDGVNMIAEEGGKNGE